MFTFFTSRQLDLKGIRKYLVFALIGFGLVAGNTSYSAENPMHLLEAAQPGLQAPAFELEDLDAKVHTLDTYLGKPLVINFWATWCPPCRAEMPALNRAWQQIKDQGINLIAISAGEDYDAVFGFTAEVEVGFPLLIDPANTAFNDWPLHGLPTTYVLNSSGEIIFRAIGEREWDHPAMIEKIKSVQ